MYERFVGSLRRTKFDGEIFLGVSKDLSQGNKKYLEDMKAKFFELDFKCEADHKDLCEWKGFDGKLKIPKETRAVKK